MSGIGAILHLDGRPTDPSDLARMARALSSHGPEQQKSEAFGQIGLVHTRMSMTPEDRLGMQPVRGMDGQLVMVFDGRLDNRAELAERLALAQSAVAEMSDADLAIRCWERWGTKSLNMWLGEFALITWDQPRRKLIAGRHQFGMRPLSYHVAGQRLLIASMPKGLHALPDVPRQVDKIKIADFLCQMHGDTRRSYFEDVHRLEPAHLLIADVGGLRTERYYDIRDYIRPVKYARDDDYVEAASEHLERATRPLLRSVGGIGAMVSGGLDSPAVATTAANMMPETLSMFTWVPERGWDSRTTNNAYGNEADYVRQIISANPKLSPNFIDAAGLGQYDDQDQMLFYCEMPLRTALNVCWTHEILRKAKMQGISTMLHGGLGNATLSYDGAGLYDYLWRAGRLGRLSAELKVAGLRKTIGVFTPDWTWSLKERVLGRGGPSARWWRYSALDPEAANRMNIHDRARQTGFTFFSRKPKRVREWWVWALTQHMAPEVGDTLHGLHAMHGVEMRDPFSNRALIEWALGVPEDQFRRNGQGRWLMKRLLDGALPKAVVHKNKEVGRQTSDWHLRMTRDMDQMRSDVAAFAEDKEISDLVDTKRLQNLLDTWPTQTVTANNDDRRYYLPVIMPLALQAGRFIERVKGSNRPPAN